MSTRSAIHFLGYGGRLTAIIYRHHDGYIAGAGKDLLTFLSEIEEAGTAGSSGLASAYVVWAAANDIQAEIMRDDPGIQFRYTVEREGRTGCSYKVMVDEQNLHPGAPGSTDDWKSYELTADLVAEEVAAMQRRIDAHEAGRRS